MPATISQPEKTRGDTPEFPSIAEQEEHWKRKEFESLDDKQLLLALDAFSEFLGELNDAIGKLRRSFETITPK